MNKKSAFQLFVFVFMMLSLSQAVFAQQKAIPADVEEFKDSLNSLLEYHGVPSIGIAIIEKDSVLFTAGLGIRNKEDSIPADENTMYRIGSVSKMFVSLSILKLQEEGKVSLDDRVRDLIPEIEFENEWEETHPILVSHLLEHTTGWDDIHLSEYALNAEGMTLKEGLDYHPHSRRSRWVPGTRTAYCNSGPPVAAYIVEKLTGMTFEKYVQQSFFNPIGMENMTYFASDKYLNRGATLYNEGAPQPYWHIIMRPSGSINASPVDMAKFVRFYLNRGIVDSTSLISEESLNRMETPMTAVGATVGLEYGYGLSNYTSTYEEFVFHGHNGGVNGGLTELAYLPEFGIGYAFMINSGNGNAFGKISDLVKSFVTRDLEKEQVTVENLNPIDLSDVEGYYRHINPRTQMFYFIDRIMNTSKLWQDSTGLRSQAFFGGEIETYLPVNDYQFLSEQTGEIGLVRAEDPLAGKVIQKNTTVKEKISAITAFGTFGILGFWLLGILSSFIFAAIWLIRLLMKKVRTGINVWIRIFPLMSSVFVVVTVIFIMVGAMDPFELLGVKSFVSVSIFIGTILYALTTIWSFIYLLLQRNAEVNRFAYWHSMFVAVFHITAVTYLYAYDVIGMMTWS